MQDPFVQPVVRVTRVRIGGRVGLPVLEPLVYTACAVSGFVVGALAALAIGPV